MSAPDGRRVTALIAEDEAPQRRALHELLRFPQSKHSDQFYSISQALAYVGSTYTLDNIF